MGANAQAATAFNALHGGPDLLVLPNAWDAGTARLIEGLGARAIATTSAGVAWAHGYADGDQLPLERLVATVAAIARVIRVPLTVDMEGGYGDDPAGVGDAVTAVIDAGGVGMNIEDGTSPPDRLSGRIEAAKAAGVRRGVDFFVNARTDVYLRGLAPEGARVEETLSRARRYRDAGADGLFAPGVTDPGEIRAIAAGTPLPLNVLARPGLPDRAALARLGVRRLSAGSGLTSAAYGRVTVLTRGFLAEGRSEPLAEGAMPYPEINKLFG